MVYWALYNEETYEPLEVERLLADEGALSVSFFSDIVPIYSEFALSHELPLPLGKAYISDAAERRPGAPLPDPDKAYYEQLEVFLDTGALGLTEAMLEKHPPASVSAETKPPLYSYQVLKDGKLPAAALSKALEDLSPIGQFKLALILHLGSDPQPH
jgi:hypothetical protein